VYVPAACALDNYDKSIIVESQLMELGIKAPFINSSYTSGYNDVYSCIIEDDDISITSPSEEYVLVDFKEYDARISYPGYPALPYKVYVKIVDGYIDEKDVLVGVKVYSYKIINIDKPIIPAPQPLAYNGDYNQSIEYRINEEVYSKDAFYPGRLIETGVFHGLNGKTIITIKFYPIQYNPYKNEVLVIEDTKIFLKYEHVEQIAFNEKSLLILTTDELKDAVEPLKEFYEEKGFNVTIIDVDTIYATYTEAENITMYPGFYEPLMKDFVREDYIYEELLSKYNWRLALRIINFLRQTYGNYSHILIVGNATEIPPSFYLQTYSYDLYNSWIPTDIFYASPDYDLVPDIYVGRIPFSDPDTVSMIVEKIISWYDTGLNELNTLRMSGGYPFITPLMFGETVLSTATLRMWTIGFNTTLMLRTNNNYDSKHVLEVLSGSTKTLWYFAVAHGDGIELVDPLVELMDEEQVLLVRMEFLASVYDLLAMKPSSTVPIVSSVACMNAIWDNALLAPPYPGMPSFGEAILLSPAGGIAYIGSARIASELGMTFTIKNGTVQADSFGAVRLHLDIISSYTDLVGLKNETTLGELIALGISKYLAETSQFIDIKYSLSHIAEIMKLSLLGDPALILKLPKKPSSAPRISLVELPTPELTIPAQVLYMLCEGDVPVYKPYTTSTVNIYGDEGDYYLRIYRIYGFPDMLYGYRQLKEEKITLDKVNQYKITYDELISGKILLKIGNDKWGEIRVVVSSAGVRVLPNKTIAGSSIVIEGFGLDIFGMYTRVDVIVAGRAITSVEVPLTGYINWTLALPYLAPGSYPIWFNVKSYYYYPEPTVFNTLKELLGTTITIYEEARLDILASMPEIIELGKDVKTYLMTVLDGEAVDAEINVILMAPDGMRELEPVRIDKGVYEVVFSATMPGLYALYVNATYNTPLVTAKGYATIPFITSRNIYEGLGKLEEQINTSTTSIISQLGSTKDYLHDLITSLNITYTYEIGHLYELLSALNTTIALGQENIYTKLASLDQGISSTESKIEALNASIIKNFNTLSVNTEKALTDTSEKISEKVDEILPLVRNLSTISMGTLILSIIVLILVSILLIYRRK